MTQGPERLGMKRTGAKADLRIAEVSADYGDVRALEDVSFEVHDSEVVAILGANGAGKTSLLRAISGVLGIRAGGIWFKGREISQLRPDEIVRLGLAHVPESRCIFPGLTVRENLELGLFGTSDGGRKIRHKLDDQKELPVILDLFPWIGKRMKQDGGHLSGGEQQMLAISRALLSRPSMLLLDEPSLGLSPRIAAEVFESLARVQASGVSMIIVEQSIHLTLQLASRGYVVNRGKIAYEGTSDELRDSSTVFGAYF